MCKTKLKCNVNYILLRQFLMERSNITSATDGGGGRGLAFMTSTKINEFWPTVDILFWS